MTTFDSFPTHHPLRPEEEAEFARLLAVGTAEIPYGHARHFPGQGTLSHLGIAGIWLAERIKATNGHERYVPGLIAQIGRWEFPLQGAEQLFEWWKREKVPAMETGEVIDAQTSSTGVGSARRKTITIGAARRLIQFVRDKYQLNLPSEYAPGLTYAQGCETLEKFLPNDMDASTPIAPKLAHEIQSFAGVAFDQRVGGGDE